MILGIGVDVINISRIQSIYDKYGYNFAKKLLAKDELAYFYSKTSVKDAVEYLSSSWASKEAVYKALYQAGYMLKNINLIVLGKSSNPYPSVTFPHYPNIRIHLSLSHEKDIVVAYSIVEKVT